jgi:hypothetical protein
MRGMLSNDGCEQKVVLDDMWRTCVLRRIGVIIRWPKSKHVIGPGWVNNNHAISVSRNSGAIKFVEEEWGVLYTPKHFWISKYKTIFTIIILHRDSLMN